MTPRHYDLKDKLAVVTGASRGIGFHTAKTLHDAGASVVITSRSDTDITAAARNIGPRAHPYVCDQADPHAVQSFADAVLASLGSPSILVANAGAMGSRPVTDMDLDFWNRIIHTNLTGTFLLCKAFLPSMIAAGRGDILIVSSMSGKKGDANSSAYAASKFGLQGFAQSLLHEVRRHNIRVTVLNPSAVNTEIPDSSPLDGPHQTLHAADLAATILHLVQLPGRTLIRDLDIWGTNPF